MGTSCRTFASEQLGFRLFVVQHRSITYFYCHCIQCHLREKGQSGLLRILCYHDFVVAVFAALKAADHHFRNRQAVTFSLPSHEVENLEKGIFENRSVPILMPSKLGCDRSNVSNVREDTRRKQKSKK
mgnify:CR=1 FL=1